MTKKRNVEAQVLAISSDTRGRPPILLELDAKFISLLKSIRSRGGVINFSVVKATALALVKSNPSSSVTGFQPTTTWVRSVYRRCGFSRRAGTTTRPPVPRGMFEECKLTFLSTVAHNCHGKNKNLTAKPKTTKYLTAKANTSRQKQILHGKSKNSRQK